MRRWRSSSSCSSWVDLVLEPRLELARLRERGVDALLLGLRLRLQLRRAGDRLLQGLLALGELALVGPQVLQELDHLALRALQQVGGVEHPAIEPDERIAASVSVSPYL